MKDVLSKKKVRQRFAWILNELREQVVETVSTDASGELDKLWWNLFKKNAEVHFHPEERAFAVYESTPEYHELRFAFPIAKGITRAIDIFGDQPDSLDKLARTLHQQATRLSRAAEAARANKLTQE